MTVLKEPAYKFDGTNPRAQRAAERQAARMVKDVSDETIAAIRGLITRSIAEGIPPYDAARSIRSMVGLASKQAQSAMNYRGELIQEGLTLERVDELVDKYTEKKIAERAETIARTEIMDALNEGAIEGWAEAQEEGLLGDGATKEVIVAPGYCPDVCKPLDGVAIPLADDFETENGPFPAPPFHPRCRCTLAVNP